MLHSFAQRKPGIGILSGKGQFLKIQWKWNKKLFFFSFSSHQLWTVSPFTKFINICMFQYFWCGLVSSSCADSFYAMFGSHFLFFFIVILLTSPLFILGNLWFPILSPMHFNFTRNSLNKKLLFKVEQKDTSLKLIKMRRSR